MLKLCNRQRILKMLKTLLELITCLIKYYQRVGNSVSIIHHFQKISIPNLCTLKIRKYIQHGQGQQKNGQNLFQLMIYVPVLFLKLLQIIEKDKYVMNVLIKVNYVIMKSWMINGCVELDMYHLLFYMKLNHIQKIVYLILVKSVKN